MPESRPSSHGYEERLFTNPCLETSFRRLHRRFGSHRPLAPLEASCRLSTLTARCSFSQIPRTASPVVVLNYRPVSFLLDEFLPSLLPQYWNIFGILTLIQSP